MVVPWNIREALLQPVLFSLLNPLFAERYEIPVHMWVLWPMLTAQEYGPCKGIT